MTKKKEVAKKSPGELVLTKSGILGMLVKGGELRVQVCKVLRDGLSAKRAVVCDGEVMMVADSPTRLKYAEVILEVLGEKKKIIPTGELHYHFTNVLQMVEAYERGDEKALKEAGRMFDGVDVDALDEGTALPEGGVS